MINPHHDHVLHALNAQSGPMELVRTLVEKPDCWASSTTSQAMATSNIVHAKKTKYFHVV